MMRFCFQSHPCVLRNSFSFFKSPILYPCVPTQIITSDLFKLLKKIHGSSYEAFMKSKLIPVTGDIGEDNLVIKSVTAAKISGEIDVIISCAGRTTFDDRCFTMFLLSIFFSLITNKQFAYSSSTLIQVRLCFECQRFWTWSAFEIWKGLQEPEIISPLFNWYEFVFSCKKK